MHIAIDWDNVVRNRQKAIATQLWSLLGYEVCPEHLVDINPFGHYGVDPDSADNILDTYQTLFPIRSGVMSLARELEFCGHKVTFFSNFSDTSFYDGEPHTSFDLLGEVCYVPRATRHLVAKDLGVDVYIDACWSTCHQVACPGVSSVWFGTHDASSKILMHKFLKHSMGFPGIYNADGVPAIRRAIEDLGGHLLPPLLGCTGRARSGKDTVCKMICELDLGYVPTSFAFPIKQLAVLLLSPDARDFYFQNLKPAPVVDKLKALYENATLKDLEEKTPEVGRPILQLLGTEVGRELVDSDLWVKIFGEVLSVMYGKWGEYGRTTISDVRYANEAQAIKQYGGVLLNIERENAGLSGIQALHVSEAMGALGHCRTITLKNDGTVEELEKLVYTTMKMLVGAETPVLKGTP